MARHSKKRSLTRRKGKAMKRTPPKQAARQKSMIERSKRSTIPRLQNILAGTADARIRGHASGANRAAQGRRDAQQRGDPKTKSGRLPRHPK